MNNIKILDAVQLKEKKKKKIHIDQLPSFFFLTWKWISFRRFSFLLKKIADVQGPYIIPRLLFFLIFFSPSSLSLVLCLAAFSLHKRIDLFHEGSSFFPRTIAALYDLYMQRQSSLDLLKIAVVYFLFLRNMPGNSLSFLFSLRSQSFAR